MSRITDCAYTRRVIALAALALIVCISGCSRGKTIGNTTYAPGFSESKFAQIKVGMNKRGVEQVAGKPLNIDHYESRTYHITDAQGRPKQAGLELNNDEVFDYDGPAHDKGVRATMSRQEAESRLGTSKSKCAHEDLIWGYSDFAYFEGEVRNVYFDAHGRVVRIDHSTSRD